MPKKQQKTPKEISLDLQKRITGAHKARDGEVSSVNSESLTVQNKPGRVRTLVRAARTLVNDFAKS